MGDMIMRYVLAGLTICLFSGLAQAGDVTVKGVHLCCGKCVTGATDALKDVNGITGLNVDKDAGSIIFQAENSEVAQNALAELAKAGFAGRATLGDENSLPKIGVKKGTTCNEFAIKDVHLCCGGCVNGVKEALEDVSRNQRSQRGHEDRDRHRQEITSMFARRYRAMLRKAGIQRDSRSRLTSTCSLTQALTSSRSKKAGCSFF
ncbi:MAG: hypothetical protein R3B91_13765 [Planctomycetaceae bacterium]